MRPQRVLLAEPGRHAAVDLEHRTATGITLIFSEARIIVGDSVTPSIGSTQHGDARVALLDLREPRREVAVGVDAERAEQRLGLRRLARAPAGARAIASSTGAIFCSALSPMRGIDAWPARPSVDEREAEHALLGHADAEQPAAVELEQLAGALVHHVVAAHLVRGAARRATWRRASAPASSSAVEHEQQLARLGAPALVGERAGGGRSRPPPGSSCRARRGPRRSRRAARPTRGRRSSPRGRRARCRRGRGSRARAVGAAAEPRDQVRPALDAASSSHLEAGALEHLACRNSCAACSLPGGLTVLNWISRCSSSVVRLSRSAARALGRV